MFHVPNISYMMSKLLEMILFQCYIVMAISHILILEFSKIIFQYINNNILRENTFIFN